MLPLRLSRAAGGCVVLFLLPLLGCSIHPLPGDIPRVATIDIVERIRCEAKAGLISVLREDPRTQKLDARILAGTKIGYDFHFDITETNNDGVHDKPGALTLEKLRKNGDSFSLGLTGSSERTRQNVRRFRIIEDLKDLNNASCSPEATQANWLYPITGNTGMDEVVRTFVKIERLADLRSDPISGTEFTPADGFFPAADQVVFSDVLRFTTTLTASATPNLVLSAAVGSLRVKQASITAAATRADTHDVVVAIARDKDKEHIIREEVLPGGRRRTVVVKSSPRTTAAAAARKKLVDTGAVVDSRTVTALIQKDAGAYNKVLIELQRLRNLEDDEREAPRLLGERLLEIMRTP